MIFAQTPLLIRPSDLRLEMESDLLGVKGYHLYIRALDSLQSVMLTETTKDPEGKSDNYAYRAFEYNSVNGDEIRILNGKKLLLKSSLINLLFGFDSLSIFIQFF